MTTGEFLFVLGVLIVVLGGLWTHQWLCATDDARRYRRWVRERERVLSDLEREDKPPDGNT